MQNETGTTPNTSRRSRKARRRAAKRAAQERARAEATAAVDVPPSALLADPATIAGALGADRPEFEEVRAESPVPAVTPPAPAEDEPERADLDGLRAALRFQSDELDTLRSRWRRPDGRAPEPTATPPTAPETRPPEPDANPTPSPLMDARSARRLAADARARERASREALEEARRANGQSTETATVEVGARGLPTEPARDVVGDEPVVAPNAAEIVRTPEPGLRASAASVADSIAAAEPTHFEPERVPSAANDEGAESGSELAELKSLLVFARETSAHQRETLRSLRARVAELEHDDAESAVDVPVETSDDGPVPIVVASDADASPAAPHRVEEDGTAMASPATSPSSVQSAADLDRLRERLSEAEAEIDRHRREKAFLEEALEERVQQLTARREELEALRDRFEAQDRALDTARREYELERTRHGRTLDTLAELQSTLARALPVERAVGAEDGPPHPVPQATPAAAGLASVVGPASPLRPEPREEDSTSPRASLGRWSTVALESGEETEERGIPRVPDSQGTHLGSGSRAYAHWLDERVRSRFGPLGAERFVDLFRDATRTKGRTGSDEHRLMVLAQDAATVAAHIAESLLLSGTSRFTIHYAEAAEAAPFAREAAELPLAFDSPLRGSLEALEPIATADALGTALDAIRPDAIVCHDFLSHAGDVEPWLDRLVGESHAGATLLLAERIGLAPSPAPPPIAEVAERIWSKLPERYTRTPSRRERIGDWQAAFQAATERPENGLLDALRARTPLALIDRFGYLALSYVDSPIAENFDVDSDRDRRFLAQIADLDERRIESGEAPPLAFVARIDPA